MKIRLDLIKPSPRPVRTSWDEEKMKGLTQSIKSQGLVVPVKLRPDNEAYQIVYGHRRVEACRRAGLAEVEAWIEGTDDFKAFLEAGIENVQVEDMPVLDKARWIAAIKEETKWSNMECERELGIDDATIRFWLKYLGEYETGAVPRSATKSRSDDQGVEKVLRVKRAFDKAGIDDPSLKRKVLEKTSHLGRDQVREVADAVAHAKDEAEREAILETDYADLVKMPEFVQAKAKAKRKTAKREKKERQENPHEVKEYLEALSDFTAAVIKAAAVAEYGKFSPEAAQFTKRKHEALRQELAALDERLEDNNGSR